MAPSANPCGCVNISAMGTFVKNLAAMDDPLGTVVEHARKNLPGLQVSNGHIFKNGTIRTMVDGDADATVEALAIKSDMIIAAGSLSACRDAVPGAEEVDLQGKCMLPGLIEPHVHILPTSIYDTWVQLSPFDGQDLIGESYKLDWVYDTLNKSMDQVKNNWLVGFGVDPSMFSDLSEKTGWMDPTAKDLDEKVSKDVCIFLMNSSGHVGYANTAALQAARSDVESGVLSEFDMVPVMGAAVKGLAGSGPGYVFDVLKAMIRMFKSAAEVGVTTIFDAGLGATSTKLELDMFNALAHTDLCPLRLGGGLMVTTEEQYTLFHEEFGITPQTYRNDKFNLPNIKLVADGSNQGLTGFQHEPYIMPNPIVNSDGRECGVWNFENLKYKELMTQVVRDGWTLMIHGNGDAAIDLLIEAFRIVHDKTEDAPLAKRHRIEHCSILTDAMLDELKALGISPSFLIGHLGYWGKTMMDNVFGRKKAMLLDRVGSAEKWGLRYTLHSDHFVSPFGPLRMAEQAVTRNLEASKNGNVPLNKPECVDIRSALKAITYDAAWQTYMDEYVGQLKAGMKADLVVLEEDPVTRRHMEGLRHVKVCQTWMGGRITHSAE